MLGLGIRVSSVVRVKVSSVLKARVKVSSVLKARVKVSSVLNARVNVRFNDIVAVPTSVPSAEQYKIHDEKC
jgi:hypothetical protein